VDDKIFLLDTPGFDDSHKADIDILEDIVVLLRYIDEHKGRISGIIYLHRITDNRVSGSTVRNFDILRKLCGEGFFRHVVLVTTMWGEIGNAEGKDRQDQLVNFFWEDMIDGGAAPMKYMDTTQSALEIIDALIRLPRSQDTIPDIQRESLEKERPLLETSAGRVIYENIKQTLQQYDSSIARIQEEQVALEQETNSGSVYTRPEKEEEMQELKREKDRLIDQRGQTEGLLQGKAAEGSGASFGTRGDHSPSQETEAVFETKPTLWMEESAPHKRSRSRRPRNAVEREDALRLKSIEQKRWTEGGLQPPEKQSADVRRKESIAEGGMALAPTMDHGSRAEGPIGRGARAHEGEEVGDTLLGIREIGSQEENCPEHTDELTLLRQAVHSGDETMLRLLVQKGADINATTVNGGTVLLWAVEKRHEMVLPLMEIGANVNAKTDNGVTALHQAARNGHDVMARHLVEKGADVNAKTASGETALHWAAENGHKEMAWLLLENGTDIKAKTASGETALHWAVENEHDAMARLLVEKGADVKAKTSSGVTALHWAVESGHDAMAQLLVDQGVDVNARTGKKVTALHWAVENRNLAVVKQLLERRADVNAKTVNGMTVLHQAGRNGHNAMAQLLVDEGADTKAKTARGETALHWAVGNGHQEVARLLLEKGTDIDAKDTDGRTALHRAAGKGQEVMVGLLLERGASLDVDDVNGRTALREAAKNEHQAVVRLLAEKETNAKVMARLRDRAALGS
jgi:ankyrin repeat protein